MGLNELFIVDVFAEEKYAGNPLAVVTNAAALSDAEMQQIAFEINFSETTFILSDEPVDGAYAVRIFTPATEIPFAGHPTLGTAYVLREERKAAPDDRVTLKLGIGPVEVTFEAEPEGTTLSWMHPPAPRLGKIVSAEPVAQMLGLDADEVDARFPIQEADTGLRFLLVPLAGLDALRKCRLDPGRRAELVSRGFQADPVFVFCRDTHEPGNDLAARMFFEAGGIREDPATGSANVCLGRYLLEHRYLDGPLSIRVEQGYEVGRPSLLRVRAREEADGPAISVGGRVIPVSRGQLA